MATTALRQSPPRFIVKLNDADISSEVEEVTYEDRIDDMMDLLRVTIRNNDLKFSLLQPFVKNADIVLYGGWVNKGIDELFIGKVHEIEVRGDAGSGEVLVLTALPIDVKNDAWNVPIFRAGYKGFDRVSDIVKYIVENNHSGYTYVVDDTPVSPVLEKYGIPQHDRSDYEFLEFLADLSGYEFFIKNKTVYFRKPTPNAKESSTIRRGNDIISYTFKDVLPAVEGAAISAEDMEEINKTVEIIAALDAKLKESYRTQYEDKSVDGPKLYTGEENESYQYSDLYNPGLNPSKAAESLAAEQATTDRTGIIKMTGSSIIRAGDTIKIEGFGYLDGKWYVKPVVIHKFARGGTYTTQIHLSNHQENA